jgi:hypothetical protein
MLGILNDGTEAYISGMTKPQMIRCLGSGRRVEGPDEPDGTVQCRVCGTSFLRMKTTATADGKKVFSVSEHERRANPVRLKGVRRRSKRKGRESLRDRGRH